MINVSDEWKEAHKQRLLPETFIELSYAVTEPGLQEEAVATANLEESYAETASVTTIITKGRPKYSSLEHNYWGLDGSFIYFDDFFPKNPGYLTSSLSGTDTAFTAIPTMEITFPNLHTVLIPGITITWAEKLNEWASRFRITVYNGSTIVAERLVEDNTTPLTKLWMDLQNYNKVVIEILQWSHPQHRARIEHVFFGIRTIYTKDDLLGYTHTQSVDLLSGALPKNEIVFRLRNEDSRWNPENPSGAERYLTERQEISVKYGMTVGEDTEWIDGGHFWLSSWSTPSNGLEATFTARDVLEFMNEKYTGQTETRLHLMAYAAFRQANIPPNDRGKNRYYVDDSLVDYIVYMKGENTSAEVLQKVAHMAGCVLYQDRDGTMRIEPRKKVLSDYVIRQETSYSHPEFQISKPLKAVEVSYGEEGRYTLAVGTSGEVQTVENDFIDTVEDAERIAKATAEVLKARKTISGEFRADPRLDALDIVTVESKFATNHVVITEIEYSTTGGAFHGRYTGKVVEDG